jgi:aspartyl-tRNA(Asn)/glutamyl-tRNA(Gln) amidotransferase subunit B
MFATGKGAAEIVKEKGLVQISDEGALVTIIEQVVAANPQSVLDFQAGKERAIGFLVGQVMKETKGQANPGVVNKLLKEKLLSL